MRRAADAALSPPQARALAVLAEVDGLAFYDARWRQHAARVRYVTWRSLVARGHAARVSEPGETGPRERVRITDAGRAALAAQATKKG